MLRFPFAMAGDQLVVVAVLFVAMFVAMAFMFARDRVGLLFLGFGRTLLSFLIAPVFYLKKTVLQLVRFGEKGDADTRTSDQYLLNQLSIAIKAGVVAIALAVLAATLVAAWEAFLPPKAVRDYIRDGQKELDRLQRDITPVNARIQQYDNDWQTKRQSLVDQFRNDRTQKMQLAVRENANTDRSADTNLRQPLQSLRAYLKNNDSVNPQEIQRIHNTAMEFLGRLSLPGNTMGQLTHYVDNWRTQKLLKLELDAMNEQEFRMQLQPDYNQLRSQSGQLTSEIDNVQRNINATRAQDVFRPDEALGVFASGFLFFLLVVWGLGLSIELISLATTVAGDVRRIREAGERMPEPPRAMAASAPQ